MSIQINYAPMNNAPTTAETCTMNKIEPFKEYVGYVSEWDGSEHVTDEQIVRCRDCVKCEESKAFSTWFCHRFSMCDSAGFPVEPDGFCKWASRRQP